MSPGAASASSAARSSCACIDHTRARSSPSPTRSCTDRAADDADAAPGDVEAARVRALVVRHLVERECTRVIEVFTRTFGPRPLAFDAEVIARVQELQLYLRQVHHGADLEELGAAGCDGAGATS